MADICPASEVNATGIPEGSTGNMFPVCFPFAPFLCEQGRCETSPLLCPILLHHKPCANVSKVRCIDGTCRDLGDCPLEVVKGLESTCQFHCLDGGCTKRKDDCLPLSACPPQSPRSCNGRCVSNITSCLDQDKHERVLRSNGESAKEGHTHGEGVVALCGESELDEAGDCHPSLRCPSQRPLQCPDGSCAAQEENCQKCEDWNGTTSLWKCAWRGPHTTGLKRFAVRCVSSFAECTGALPLSHVQVKRVSFLLDKHEHRDVTLSAVANDIPQVVAEVTVPVGAFNFFELGVEQAMLRVGPASARTYMAANLHDINNTFRLLSATLNVQVLTAHGNGTHGPFSSDVELTKPLYITLQVDDEDALRCSDDADVCEIIGWCLARAVGQSEAKSKDNSTVGNEQPVSSQESVLPGWMCEPGPLNRVGGTVAAQVHHLGTLTILPRQIHADSNTGIVEDVPASENSGSYDPSSDWRFWGANWTLWKDIPEGTVESLQKQLDISPTEQRSLTVGDAFAPPQPICENCGQRLLGWFIPNMTGNHTFTINSHGPVGFLHYDFLSETDGGWKIKMEPGRGVQLHSHHQLVEKHMYETTVLHVAVTTNDFLTISITLPDGRVLFPVPIMGNFHNNEIIASFSIIDFLKKKPLYQTYVVLAIGVFLILLSTCCWCCWCIICKRRWGRAAGGEGGEGV
eukprot:gnl/MRDRNA2_/MRDRNA2_111592_c0_seq1.p1 gnl/MRDRNA2_/MRDRNA2_111592_c0~~gnl/MRDRNA2_/MRDRNA2_111592_c0_seq1.p1  ORF type:complete len:789 (+),score=100.96 gnl/MRDRNA2_/MRDRNA2_111592_c0_seq1:308-2368(+)